MNKRRLGRTGISISPIILGGNVFGWTTDEKTSFDVLDACFEAGLNTIDTADVYSSWVPGNIGGESETIIGKWLKRGTASRDKTVVITKVGSEMGEGKKGLSEAYIMTAVEASLRRLQTDYIDVYLSHWHDAETPYEETLGAYEKLKAQGKIRASGCSNLDVDQLTDALAAAEKNGVQRYDVLQPEYNLYDRSGFEGALSDLCVEEDIAVITYYSLASGFLSGKYRSKADVEGRPRGDGLLKYFDDKGTRILAALDQISKEEKASAAEVALAWLLAKRGVTAPIASATSVNQAQSLARAAQLSLSDDAITVLDKAGL
ncbi:alcohol dehydrogenase [Agrobacterium sp. 13-626]|nr:alcohol dehydrogenase [Agrobacterium sp. 13-626]